jgi:hypothetical protein
MIKKNNGQHIWQFSRVGGVNRVNLESGADLGHLSELDQKLWTALSCPVNGLEINPLTLKLIDTDDDGKIRVPEIIEAVRWILSVIKNPDDLLQRPEFLPLDAINSSNPEGEILLASAQQILSNLGKPDGRELTIAETSDTQAIFADTPFNGDGIITEISTGNENLKTWISNVIECCGNVMDRSGREGIDTSIIAAFNDACASFSAWRKLAEEDASSILPFGDDTDEAFNLLVALQPKIDDYFLRCRLTEFDPASAEILNGLAARMEAISQKDISACINEIETFPIARIVPGKSLSLNEPFNPAWRERMLRFLEIIRESGGKSLIYITEEKWKEISCSLVPYRDWCLQKTGAEVEKLGYDRVREYLSSGASESLASLIAEDLKLETEAGNILLVDKLVRYYCEIYTLLNNFVCFSDFYSPDLRGIFQAGTLYFDQRSCDLCIRVADMGKHNLMAASSGICLVYFDCISRAKGERMTIVAAFTDGDVDNLEVGRNAVFYDNAGLDWDASIIKIIDNPISIRQAFWSPYRKISKMISNQVKKFASAQDDKVTASASAAVEKTGANLEKSVNQAVTQPEAAPKPAQEPTKPAPFDIGKFAGIFAAVGLAFAAIGSVLTSIIGGFLRLEWWKMPLALIGVMLLISGPSMFLAWLKLRKRNLAPVLDANGWAINAKAIINIPFGGTLTHLARLPKNAQLNLRDPFRKKRRPLIPTLILLAAVAAIAWLLWHYGFLSFSFGKLF